MDARLAQRIEGATSLIAAAIFAAAVAFAVNRLSGSALVVGAAAASALFIALLALRSIDPAEEVFPLAHFAPQQLAFEELEELILTDADRLSVEQASDELVLDDVLGKLGEESRVVRLFDVSAMPTPGQLKARIDRHLGQAQSAATDASAALHDALAELRLSLK